MPGGVRWRVNCVNMEVAKLVKALNALLVNGNGRGTNSGAKRARRRRRRRRRNGNAGPMGPGVPAASSTRLSTRPELRSTGAGAITLTHTEFWGTLTTAAGGKAVAQHLEFAPGKSNLAFLDGQGRAFERYWVSNCTVHFKTALGTGDGGYIILGVDWDLKKATTQAGIQVHNPNLRTAVWKEASMQIPSSRLRNRIKLQCASSDSTLTYDHSAFILSVWISAIGSNTTAVTVGDIWCTYTVHFDGPRA